MTTVVKLGHPERRRMIVDSLPAPPVTLRVPRGDDELDTARGVLLGALLGGAIWIGILAWIIWN